jgi:ubiquinone/menaquinone biosynthesis C-methylase UbiE
MESLPFADNAFDGIVCSSVLEYLRDPDRCLAELYRVLRLNGRLVISVPNRHSALRVLRKALHTLSKPFASQPLFPYLAISHHDYSEEQMVRDLTRHGFRTSNIVHTGSAFPAFVDHNRFIGNLIVVLAVKGDYAQSLRE